MKKELFRKGFVLGIFVLFVGIAVQPGIIAADSIKSDNSEMVEITIQICKGDEAEDHNVILSQKQAEELESLINRTKAKLDAVETLEETSAIFNDAVVSLYELGVLPEGMSIEEAKRLVNGMDQNPNVINKLEQWFFRNQEKIETFDNFLCLIAGHTDRTFFIGPSLIPSLFLTIITAVSIELLDILLSILFISGLFNSSFFNPIQINWFILFMLFGGLNLLTWQFIPLAIGHIIKLGGKGGFGMQIPAEGWINTIGLKGIKIWNEFYGWILGFIGIKICFSFKEDWTQFYMGATLMLIDTM